MVSATAERMRPQLQLTRLGAVAGVLAAGLCGAAVASYPPDAGPDLVFPLLALAAAVVLLAVCVLQLALWSRVFDVWNHDRDYTDTRTVRVSWWTHWLSYPVLLAGLYLCIEASALGGFSELPGFCLGLAALAMLVAQTTSAVQYLREDGPPGTVPTHVRRLLAWVRSQR
ncbi:putative membrane protein YfcA [Friedmanniella endophytica]|uniref:Putative membrane protein YfcA n=1 Tax=Microlunatus kandeliicorticis TaxID=1759536 RepID=A0A7W3IVV9_9ACTN|nr:hypothetical protein [Microlunatus kandeliicorticis]MBA8796207.1 putative membrane protein YfcA [Microlunatus kandeliicorticis]